MKKARIFENMAASYAAVTGNAPTYLCPLCLVCELSSVTDEKLTWDHVPTRKIGGRLQMPVCRQCNWTAGATVEAHLDRYLKRQQFAGRYGQAEPVKLKVTGTGISHRSAFRIENEAIMLVGRDEANPPEATEQAFRRFGDALNRGAQLVIESDLTLIWSRRYIECAFLKAAYLYLFWRRGYSAILAAPFELVRQQLGTPNRDVMRRMVGRATRRTDKPRIELVVANRGTRSECLIVYFGGFKMDEDTVVMLPVPGDANLRKYTRAAGDFGPGKTLRNLTPL